MGNKLLHSRVFFSKNPSLCKARNLRRQEIWVQDYKAREAKGWREILAGRVRPSHASSLFLYSLKIFLLAIACILSTKAKIWLRADHLAFELIWFGQESLVETEIFPQRISPWEILFSVQIFSLEISLQDIKWRVPSFSVKDSTKFQKSFWIQYFSVWEQCKLRKTR